MSFTGWGIWANRQLTVSLSLMRRNDA